ncbi:MAG: DUF2017 domain-containing protein [Actinomycetota bacterium]|nr:DUF2017 domain-containing protein [Actinomycetota bacterium]MDQ2956188.1 DUF2017 domain-containing protein [Actinomycetota bacterium]
MKIRRKAELLRMDLADAETSLLAGLLDDFSGLLGRPDVADPVFQRLYPAGYTDDEAASAEYRELVEHDLSAERIARITACQAELPTGSGRILLNADAADRWLRVLNDLRLALGTRLEVNEEDELDDADPAVNIYHWLSAVQDLLVSQLMD